MDSVYSRLKRCRELLGFNQSQMADVTDMSQRDISELEAGKKKFIPTDYIQFLNNQGFSLDWIFNGGPDRLMKRTYQWIHSPKEDTELSQVADREGDYYKVRSPELEITTQEYFDLMMMSKKLDEMKPVLDKLKRLKQK
jgi:transcriptional regulator with XRE-family HTH domain